VNTGTNLCIFDRSYAEALGVDIKAEQLLRVGAATGTFDAYGHTLLTFQISLRHDSRDREQRV
jgi:hypothetical protein